MRIPKYDNNQIPIYPVSGYCLNTLIFLNTHINQNEEVKLWTFLI